MGNYPKSMSYYDKENNIHLFYDKKGLFVTIENQGNSLVFAVFNQSIWYNIYYVMEERVLISIMKGKGFGNRKHHLYCIL
jgi:hypothetical protein